jgi:hypothetical protein
VAIGATEHLSTHEVHRRKMHGVVTAHVVCHGQIAGNGAAMTISGTGPWNLAASIDVTNWNEGSYTLAVRARDATGNWSSPATRPVYLARTAHGLTADTQDLDAISVLGAAYTAP